MPEPRRVILVIPPRSYRAGAFEEAAARLGLEVIRAMGMDPRLAEFWRVPLAVDLDDPGAAVDKILHFARERAVHAVVPVDEAATVVAALACDALGLPHNEPGAAIAARDKYRMRERLAAAGVPCPTYRLVPPDADAASLAASISYPCVVKPRALSGSRGVIRANDAAEFAAAIIRVRAIAQSSRPVSATAGDPGPVGDVLVEEFIPGIEVALEGLLRGGRLSVLALFDKPDPLDGPFFEETIYVTPSRLSDTVQRGLRECAAAAASALGLTEGPLHAELRWNERGPWVVEVAGRSIGGLCSRVLRSGAGIDLEELILRHACGLHVPSPRAGQAAGVMMIPIPGRGVLRGCAGIERARRVPLIEDIQITAPTGYTVVPLPEGESYLGFLFARGDDPAGVEAALRTAHSKLAFTLEPELPVLA